jgi:phosphoribosylanthranilate isomerase
MARAKICGMTNAEDAALAADLGAWAVGLIFHPPSPRACSDEAAEQIGAQLRRRLEVCGVFVNPTLDRVAELVDRAGLTMVQLHGDEGPAFCAEVGRRTGAKVVKAMPARSLADLQALEAFHTDFHMLDAHHPDLRGGTGTTFDWELVRQRRSPRPLIVSGGLTPENVGDAIAATRPFAVDVASGVEAEPGRKDPAKVEAFLSAALAVPA